MTAQPGEPQIGVSPQPVAQQQIAGPTGTYVSFMDPDAASTIAAQIEQAAARARTGLIVAAGVAGLNGRQVG